MKEEKNNLEFLNNYNNFDISLAPLKEHMFNKVKSQLKVIEAGFHKKALIAQNFGPYQIDCINAMDRGGKINHKGNCLLGERLYEDIVPKYHIDVTTKYRAEVYRELIRKS